MNAVNVSCSSFNRAMIVGNGYGQKIIAAFVPGFRGNVKQSFYRSSTVTHNLQVAVRQLVYYCVVERYCQVISRVRIGKQETQRRRITGLNIDDRIAFYRSIENWRRVWYIRLGGYVVGAIFYYKQDIAADMTNFYGHAVN